MRATFVYLGIVLFFAAGCGKETPQDIAENLKEKGTMDVLKQAGEDDYEPPEDGKLTEEQIEMYLEVRERGVEIARVAKEQLEQQAEEMKKEGDSGLSGLMKAYKGLGSAADFVTSDIRAAQELGYNTAEYQWVKGKVIEASAAEYTEKAKRQLTALTDQAYASLKKQYEEETDETAKATYKKMLDEMEKQRSEAEEKEAEVDESVIHNRELLSGYEDTLKALAVEASKWSDEDKDADQMTDQMRENLEKTTSAQEQ